ncbi:vacuolar protein sorting-associated protein 37A-like [Chelonus insularis]|uniref:vacuolar protein sorting-associated protein 37A-like n=1 Tax=Chelonus insularis TaxID=460826 RepID=UPI00158EF39A|nr:vacuolar protein sorting-associated protein 37A-like [Chelonus insularis]XP_034933814.1 vacuolar protein sorting-associated protein 37A-like [Chelonus insularis]
MISRIFRGEHENTAVKRKRQIDTLKIFNDNVVELREDAEYQVQFDAGDKRMAIMVSLTPDFPLEKPILRVSPPVSHSWCNEHSEITRAPGLLNFTMHSDLGRVVQAIIREFSKNPPQVIDEISLASNLKSLELQDNASTYGLQQLPELQSMLYNSYYNSQYPTFPPSSNIYKYNYVNSSASNEETTSFASTSHRPTYSNSPGQSTGSVSPVQYSSDRPTPAYINSHYGNSNYGPSASNSSMHPVNSFEFPELNNLSNEELIELRNDQESLDDFLYEHSEKIKNINSLIDETIDDVEKLASDNLSKETELKALRDEVASKINTVSELKARYDNLIQQYNKLSQVFTPDHIKECLKRAADESHEQSEKIAESFLEQKIDVERFLSTYIECRKLGQARRTKEEKLAHQLNELKRAGY